MYICIYIYKEARGDYTHLLVLVRVPLVPGSLLLTSSPGSGRLWAVSLSLSVLDILSPEQSHKCDYVRSYFVYIRRT